jgi:DNA sulfur modification protein DndB
MGFLTIDGGDLVVLDGQHRLAALRGVVTAGTEIQGPYRDDVVNDELCVIFVEHESFEKTRRIFNKVNRYAKPTSDSDNILTSEDDGYAIVSRWLVEDQPPLDLSEPKPPFANFKEWYGEPLVEWRNNQLTLNADRITTLVSVYATVKTILSANGIENFDERHRVNRPSDRELRAAYEFAATWWSCVLSGIPVFDVCRTYPSRIPELRGYHERFGLLLTPAGQQAFFIGLRDAFQRGMPVGDSVGRARKLEWRRSDPIWIDVLVYSGGRMIARENNVKLAGRLASYRLSGHLWNADEIESLRDSLRDEKQDGGFKLPRPPRP